MLLKEYILLSINFAFIFCGQKSVDIELPKDQWFEQRLNHFDPQDNRTWNQRYFINETFYEKNGPIFLYIGPEDESTPYYIISGQMPENYAKRFKAMSVLLEHRFYGKSRPFEDLSVDNLRYLSTQQALQDIAFFIEYLNNNMTLNGNKWVVFGGSYAGALAAWFQAKYPHLSSGAVASSAPMKIKMNFGDNIGVVMKNLGDSCVESIREVTKEFEDKLKTEKGCKEIEKQFNLCDPLDGTHSKDVSHLMWILAQRVWRSELLYKRIHFENHTDITLNVTQFPTSGEMCQMLSNDSGVDSVLERYSNFIALVQKSFDEKCFDFKYDKFVTKISKTEYFDGMYNSYFFSRQWVYQYCTEFGLFWTSDYKDSPFGHHFPEAFFTQMCADIYGPKYTPEFIKKAVDFTNNYYGGKNIKVRKVVFVNGSVDPTYAMSFIEDLNEDAKALFINGTSHCEDMFLTADDDSKELTDARKQISEAIKGFLDNN